jgi:hypothetical protein
MRLKYPHVAVGALASSAPILQFEDIVPPETFYDIVSNAFKVCFSSSFAFISVIVFIICIWAGLHYNMITFFNSVKVPAVLTL